MNKATLPRNTTRQAEAVLYGELARSLHRFSGVVIILFVLVHVVVQAVNHVPMFIEMKAAAPWLQPLQQQHWIHAIVLFAVVVHTLYGLKLLAGELGFNINYKASFWIIALVGMIFGIREVVRYAGV